MRIDRTIFALVLGLSALLGIALFLPEASNSRGLPHATYETMQQGGPGLERHARVLWLGWAIGLAEIALFASLMSLGVRAGDRRRALAMALGRAGLAYAITWTALVLAYGRFAADPSASLVMGFPLPTAILFYGMWFVPMLFVWVFVRGFRRWVLTDADMREFERIVADSRRRVD